jgi:hypothetical protein
MCLQPVWRVWYTDAKVRHGVEVKKNEHGYMGWKTWFQRKGIVKEKKGMVKAKKGISHV